MHSDWLEPLFTEWRFAAFSADLGLGYFLAHITALKPITLLMLALGAFFSYRFALGVGARSRNGDSRNA